jgi:PEP-CTERM motif
MRTRPLLCATVALLGLQAQAAELPYTVGTTGTTFGDLANLSDGDFSLTTWWSDLPNVHWVGQEGATGATLVFDLGGVQLLQDITLSQDNNDVYQLDTSLDGSTWRPLITARDFTYGGQWGGASLLKKSSDAAEALSYVAHMDFAPVQAAYVRLYAVQGDALYAMGEVQFNGMAAPVPEPSSVAMMLAGAAALLGLQHRRRHPGR